MSRRRGEAQEFVAAAGGGVSDTAEHVGWQVTCQVAWEASYQTALEAAW